MHHINTNNLSNVLQHYPGRLNYYVLGTAEYLHPDILIKATTLFFQSSTTLKSNTYHFYQSEADKNG